MADENSNNNSGYMVPPPSSDEGRKRAQGDEERAVVFVERTISQEKLESLKSFLKTATADDIATIRKMYGDNLAVLRLIGLEIEALEDL